MTPLNILRSTAVLRSCGLALAVVTLSQCSAPVSVRMEKPVAPVGAPAPRSDTARLLDSIRKSHGRILRGDDSAIPTYNYSVARLVEEIERSGADPWSQTLVHKGDGSSFRLRGLYPSGSDPLGSQLVSTDVLDFRGDYVGFESKTPGLGAPIVEGNSYDKLGRMEFRKTLPLRKGDTPDSSDGVVAYWSSHLDGAASEKVVPSGHGSHQNPEGIEEASRILHLHLKKAP